MVWALSLEALGTIIVWALLMDSPRHPFSLDLNSPVVPFRDKIADASTFSRANMVYHGS